MTTPTNFTHLETKVLESLIANLYAEPGFSDVSDQDLVNNTGIPSKSIRGVLSSLGKKGVIFQESARDLGIEGADFNTIVFLNSNHYHLHPEWCLEA